MADSRVDISTTTVSIEFLTDEFFLEHKNKIGNFTAFLLLF